MNDFENQKKDPIGLSKEDLETLFEATFEKLNPTDKTLKSSPHLPPFFESKNDVLNAENKGFKKVSLKKENRTRSSLRIKYEAEIGVIKKSLGDIEEIRRSLGLSKRKMAQLLLVDPSAWTRWSKEEGGPPPHIYRALQWYMILQEKHPELRASVWLNNVARPQISRHEIESIKRSIRSDISLENKSHLWEENTNLTQKLKRQGEQSKIQIDQLKKRMKFLIASQILFFLGYAAFKVFF